MLHSLATFGRLLIAVTISVMMVFVCPCEPCGPSAALAAAMPAAEQVSDSGCCPHGGDEHAGDDASEHDCAHCSADAPLLQAADHADWLHHLASFPLANDPAARRNTGTQWKPVVQPVVVRRAHGPPELLWAPPSSERLAQLSVLRC